MKNIIKKITTGLALFAFTSQIHAQQPVSYNLHTVNPFLLNPAYTGYNGCFNAFINSHNQWTNLNDAPAAYTLGAQGNIGKNASLGGMLVSDNRTYVNYITANIMYAYKLKFKNQQALTLGLSAGIANNSLNTEKLYVQSQNDPMIQNFNSTRFNPGFGALYSYKALRLGFSMPQIFNQSGEFSSQYNLQAAYDYDLKNKDWRVTPVILARNYRDVGMIYDVHGMATWKEKLMAQVGYRTDESIIAGIGFNWENLTLAYAYQYNVGTTYNAFSGSGTQEIQLSFKLCKSSNENKPNEKADGNANKVNVVVNMIDEKYQTPVAGNITILKGNNKVYSGSGNESGKSSFYLEPGVYQMVVSAKGYLPLQEEIDLSKNAKGSQYDVALKSTKIEKGLVFKFKTVNFETGSDKLMKSSYNILDKMAEILTENPKMVVEAAGYTDNVGDDAKNLILSEKRAKSVAAYLLTKGVNASQVKAKGYGEANPIADNNTESGRLQNRRVMFTVLEF